MPHSSNAKGFLWRTKSTTWPLTFNGYVPDDPYWPNEKSTFWLVLWKKCLLVRFQLLVSLHLILSAVNCVRLVDLSSLKNSLILGNIPLACDNHLSYDIAFVKLYYCSIYRHTIRNARLVLTHSYDKTITVPESVCIRCFGQTIQFTTCWHVLCVTRRLQVY